MPGRAGAGNLGGSRGQREVAHGSTQVTDRLLRGLWSLGSRSNELRGVPWTP